MITSKAVGGEIVAAHGHLIEVMKRRGSWEAYLEGDVFPLAPKPMKTRRELIAWLRSGFGKHRIELEERFMQSLLPIGYGGEG